MVRTTFKTRKSKDSRPDEENEELVDHDHELVALQENSRPIIKSNIDLNQPDEAEPAEGSLDSQIGKLVSDLMDGRPLPHCRSPRKCHVVKIQIFETFSKDRILARKIKVFGIQVIRVDFL